MSFDNSNADGLGIQEHSKGPVFPVVESIIGHHDIGPDAETYISRIPYSDFSLQSPTRGGQRRNSNLLLKFETLADIAWQQLRQNGGFSVNIDGDCPPSEGYMVSRVGYEQIHDNPPYGVVYRFIAERYLDGSVTGSTTYFGGWVDNGQTYLDVSDYIVGKQAAISLGRGRGQLAVYDIANAESLYL